jgi:hypothetical protein
MESRGALFATTAAIEVGTGLALLIVPAAVLQLLLGVASPSSMVLVVGRVLGVALLIFGAAAWWSRRREARSQTGLLYVMLAYNVGIAIVLAAAYSLKGLSGVLLWPVVLLHSVLAAWCLYELRARRRLA